MTYSQLKTLILQIAHRSDLNSQVAQFVQNAQDKINQRLTLALVPLVNPDDTDTILTQFPMLYVQAALISLYEFINEGELVQYYQGSWNDQVDQYNITSTAAGSAPVITGA